MGEVAAIAQVVGYFHGGPAARKRTASEMVIGKLGKNRFDFAVGLLVAVAPREKAGGKFDAAAHGKQRIRSPSRQM